MPEGDLKAVTEKYSARAPKPLNTQFPDRRGKEEAVELHAGRKKRMATELYPPGKSTVEELIIRLLVILRTMPTPVLINKWLK